VPARPSSSRWPVGALAAALLLSGCTAEEAPPESAPTTAGPVATGPLTEDDLVRTSIGINDPSRVTDPTPGAPGDEVDGRNLPTTLIYPDVPDPLPVVVFTHGLGAEPAAYDQLLTAWALAGFAVVAPHHPLTVAGSSQVFDDVPNQPGDVSAVIDAVLELAEAENEDLAGRVDSERIAMVGHSAGGITTLGLLSPCCADDRIDAAVVLAGSPHYFGGEIARTDVPTLFVHPTEDTVLPIEPARGVFENAPMPAAFLELVGGTHSGPFQDASDPLQPAVLEATTDFLDWALTDDAAALADLRQISSRFPDAVLTGDRLPQ
jgi:alpha-beta hydrolase superfamily lysophospholipase